MINAISAADNYCIYHVQFTGYSELVECSRPIRFFIVSQSLMYNNIVYMSAIQEYVHADAHTQPTFEMMPGFKPFAVISIFIYILC